MTYAPARLVRYVADAGNLPISASAAWLSAAERHELDFFAHADRRSQWLGGRWIAKRLITRSCEPADLRRVEVLSRSSDGLGKAPEVFVDGKPTNYRISVSHAGGALLVGMTTDATSIGVDLAWDVPQDRHFSAAWFTEREQAWLAERPESASLLWGLKEAIFKSQGAGQTWNPRGVEIESYCDHEVRCTLYGRQLAPLAMWTRPSSRGMATAVWQATANDTPAYPQQELSSCL
ncbi:4'-phosphopantetheinyl transferase superfamily protein [Blastopirellula sp. JC732]|uniref:4'-phosphopantetheinyl transferase superfamily protein n=1 Tax=Blastopirellula sediminis TaxID=2894196 RepID=A0A9X1MIQ8_9BACT|nr:4'-phosphopantetheinyl transferase superfamily protein [Blastopirellula sediminis]MCC9607891.1 4'-phosphopantetheinyl transferase superfamily protein [Blastopirellula sediminis]MCC9627316.1 4'-phosphopantetheinyl transferase superfamily protein [Blastopirellula sediminis]